MAWTEDRVDKLKALWKKGLSASQIAEELGENITRNAVIGKAHRLGLSSRPSPVKKPAQAKRKPAAKNEYEDGTPRCASCHPVLGSALEDTQAGYNRGARAPPGHLA